MRNRKKAIATAAVLAAVATSGGLAACSNQLNDQGGVAQANPDYILTYLNVDGFPNVTVLCIQGLGFVTISRDYNSLTPEPKLDGFCASKQAAQPHIIPGTGTTDPGSADLTK